jgi:uncharacterized protein
MLAFLSMALLIYGAMHLYALGKVWLAFRHSLALTLALALWGLVMTLSPLILWQMTRQNWHGPAFIASWVIYLWMGFLFLFCCIALMFDLGHALATLFDLRWRMDEPMSFVTAGLLAAALLGYGFVEARKIDIEEIRIATPKLASGQVTIAQISDLHLGVMQGDELLERVIARLREIRPDIVVATGDIVDGQGDDLDQLARRFLAIRPPKGAYAVIGNHEYFAGLENSLRFLRSAGFTVLRGESAATGGIILAGVDDPSAGAQRKDASMATRAALASARENAYIVLLKHQPVVDRDIPFDLQLSGHIHGGQIFPFGLLTRLVYGVSTGLTRLSDGRLLYVSRGAGTWGPPIRLFAAPEITLIRIESENK